LEIVFLLQHFKERFAKVAAKFFCKNSEKYSISYYDNTFIQFPGRKNSASYFDEFHIIVRLIFPFLKK